MEKQTYMGYEIKFNEALDEWESSKEGERDLSNASLAKLKESINKRDEREISFKKKKLTLKIMENNFNNTGTITSVETDGYGSKYAWVSWDKPNGYKRTKRSKEHIFELLLFSEQTQKDLILRRIKIKELEQEIYEIKKKLRPDWDKLYSEMTKEESKEVKEKE